MLEPKVCTIPQAFSDSQSQKAIFIINLYAKHRACPTNRFRFWFAHSQNL